MKGGVQDHPLSVKASYYSGSFWSLRLSRLQEASAWCSMAPVTAVLSSALFLAALCAARDAPYAPFAWAYLSSAVWTTWLVSKGWNALHFWDKVHLLWGAGSAVAMCKFTSGTALAGDPFEVWLMLTSDASERSRNSATKRGCHKHLNFSSVQACGMAGLGRRLLLLWQ